MSEMADGFVHINGARIPCKFVVEDKITTTAGATLTISSAAHRPEPSREDRALVERLSSYRPLWKRRLGIAR
jgi:hypothetical protein